MYYHKCNQHLMYIIDSLFNQNKRKNGQNHYITKLLVGFLSLRLLPSVFHFSLTINTLKNPFILKKKTLL